MTTSDTREVKIESIIEDEVQIKKILVPLDGSNCSFRAAKYAIEVARLQNAQVYCVHAINAMPKELGGNGQWSLFDLSVDPQERKDLSKEQPALLKELTTAYDQFPSQTHIIPPDFAVLGLSIPDKTAIDG